MRWSVSLLAAALGILVVPANVRAQSSPGYGAAGSTQPGTCTDTTGIGPCQIKFDVPNVQFVGGQGQDVSTSVSYANSSATLSATRGDLYLPEIKGQVTTSGDGRIGAFVKTYQVYQYTGTNSTPFALDMLFHYTNSFQGNTVNEYAGEGFASFWAELLPGDPFSTLNDRLGFSLGGSACGDGASSLAFSYLDDFGTSGENTLTTTLGAGCGIMLAPGEIFTVATWSQFAANRGGFVDASHTAGLKLSDSLSADQQQNLLSYLVAVSVVPEPSTWTMMLLGFGLLGFALRSERQRPKVSA